MDLKIYYQKIREVEQKIAEEFPLIVSRETADGGKEGTTTEVPRKMAAKLIVDGLSRLASAEEATHFRKGVAEAKRLADKIAAMAQVQLTVLSPAELERLKAAAESYE